MGGSSDCTGTDVQNWADNGLKIGWLLIGFPLMVGAEVRLAGIGGVVMYVFMYLAIAVPPANNPIVEDRILGALTIAAPVRANASVYLGVGKWWQTQKVVQKHPILR